MKKDNINENIQPEAVNSENAVVEENVVAAESNEGEAGTQVEYVYKEMSPLRAVARRFFRSKLSIVGLVMILFLILFSFLGPVIYDKWGEETVDRTKVVQNITSTRTYTDENGKEVEVYEVLEHESDANYYADPSKDHLLGTDDKGMDVFVRLMYGGRISLTIGFIVVILETIIGIILGGIAGYFGGWVDQIIMRIVDIFNCIPTLPILLIASALIDSWQVSADTRIYLLMAIITLFSWSGVARLVRGQILSLREQEYITATEVMGLPTWRKIFLHLIPNVMPQLIVSMTLGLGSVILYESTLSYLGLGVQLPKAAWGTMIATSNDPQVLSFHMNMWLPAGIMIVIAVLGFNFVGDGLRDAMDPKAKK
ncbi:MAG: ABC transporter permease [Christensenellaceae bacterium]|nr:ABC transporter permease [Christensenellaceae bacterium]